MVVMVMVAKLTYLLPAIVPHAIATPDPGFLVGGQVRVEPWADTYPSWVARQYSHSPCTTQFLLPPRSARGKALCHSPII